MNGSYYVEVHMLLIV